MALVKNIKRFRHKGVVHDLCVENTHTYNVEGLAVHNSAAGSLVSYCLGLTGVDPIQYGLLFERFLDESRSDPPDIDTDFDPRVREWVKTHAVEVFGKDNVCSIGTYSTFKTRAVILDVARALNLDWNEAGEVTKQIEPLRSFEDEDGEDQKVDQMDFEEICQHYPVLKAYFELHPEVRHHAEILRNQVRNMGTHAGGLIISDQSLNDKIPVMYDKPGSEDRKIISAWCESGSTSELSSVGLVKFDILGLNNLPVISGCISLVEKTRGIKIARKDIPIDDRESILFGSKKDLVGIFQLENPATMHVVKEVEMESLNDVAAITSLIRPGPRDMGMDMEYAERKHGKKYDMPEFMRVLMADTYGVLTYQEQCCPYNVGVLTSKGYKKIGDIVKSDEKFEVLCLNESGDVVIRNVVGKYDKGVKPVYRLTLDNGFVLECTEDHKVLTKNRGWVEAQYLGPDDDILTSDDCSGDVPKDRTIT